jgi:hypothetical protein
MAKAWSEQTLIRFLEKHDIPVSAYGAGHAKTVKDLLASIRDGEIILRKPGAFAKKRKGGRRISPLLLCSKVKVDIFCDADPDGQVRYLVEGSQLLNGERRERSWRRSLSEKVAPGESIFHAAKRGMEEELGLAFDQETEPRLSCYDEYIASARESNSFPGFRVAGPRARLVTMLHPSLYVREGYDEHKDGEIRTHFGWKLASDVWDMR